MWKNIRPALILVTCGMISGGCTSRIIKEGYYGATGSSGHYILLSGDEQQCRKLPFSHGVVQMDSIQNMIGDACPAQFIQILPKSITDELLKKEKENDEKKPFLRGPANKKLLITGAVIHYDEGKLLDQIVGPMEEAICRLQIRDAQTNTLYAEANFVSRAKSSVRKGPKELAEGIGKAIKKLLKSKDE
jgi:hypothetical protein